MVKLTKEDLLAVAVPTATTTYKPIAHKVLFENAYELLDKRGLFVVKEDFRTDNKGEKLIARIVVDNGDSDMKFMIAFRNSYDKSMSVAYAAGTQIMICSNGAVRGEFALKHKHSGSVVKELDNIINLSIDSLDGVYKMFKKDFTTMKDILLTNNNIAELSGELFFNEKVLNSAQLSIVKQEFEKPTYSEFSIMNLYSYYNWVTHALKTSHSSTMIQNHINLHKFITTKFGL